MDDDGEDDGLGNSASFGSGNLGGGDGPDAGKSGIGKKKNSSSARDEEERNAKRCREYDGSEQFNRVQPIVCDDKFEVLQKLVMWLKS